MSFNLLRNSFRVASVLQSSRGLILSRIQPAAAISTSKKKSDGTITADTPTTASHHGSTTTEETGVKDFSYAAAKKVKIK
jgi:hypothetical protein